MIREASGSGQCIVRLAYLHAARKQSAHVLAFQDHDASVNLPDALLAQVELSICW